MRCGDFGNLHQFSHYLLYCFDALGIAAGGAGRTSLGSSKSLKSHVSLAWTLHVDPTRTPRGPRTGLNESRAGLNESRMGGYVKGGEGGGGFSK